VLSGSYQPFEMDYLFQHQLSSMTARPLKMGLKGLTKL